MQTKETIHHILTLDPEELKEAIVFWLTRSPKNNTETCQIASYMHNSDCKFSMPRHKPLTITFTYDKEQETL